MLVVLVPHPVPVMGWGSPSPISARITHGTCCPAACVHTGC